MGNNAGASTKSTYVNIDAFIEDAPGEMIPFLSSRTQDFDGFDRNCYYGPRPVIHDGAPHVLTFQGTKSAKVMQRGVRSLVLH